MRPLGRHRLWSVGGLALVLAAGVVAEVWPAAVDRSANETLPPVASPVAASSAPDAPPLDEWADTALSRPLFAPDRRPDAVTAAPDESLPRLAGTIRLADTALALFQPLSADGTARTTVVADGADVSGWTVLDITDDDVTLFAERPGRYAALELRQSSRVAPPSGYGFDQGAARKAVQPFPPAIKAAPRETRGKLSSNGDRHQNCKR